MAGRPPRQLTSRYNSSRITERGHHVRQHAQHAPILLKNRREDVRAWRSGGQDVRAPIAPLSDLRQNPVNYFRRFATYPFQDPR